MKASFTTMRTRQLPTAGRARRTIQLTRKGWLAVEMERRRREHPELDPVEGWVEIPDWMCGPTSRQGED